MRHCHCFCSPFAQSVYTRAWMLVQLLRCLTLKLTSVFHCQLQKAVVSSSLLVVVYRNRTMLLPNTSVKIPRLCRQRLSSLCLFGLSKVIWQVYRFFSHLTWCCLMYYCKWCDKKLQKTAFVVNVILRLARVTCFKISNTFSSVIVAKELLM